VNDLVGIKAVWTEAKISALVAAQDPSLAKRVDGLFADTEAKIAALGDPWDQVLAASKDSLARKHAEAVVVALQSLADGLKDVGNRLGVLVLIPTG
jgi:predicted lipoprotein